MRIFPRLGFGLKRLSEARPKGTRLDKRSHRLPFVGIGQVRFEQDLDFTTFDAIMRFAEGFLVSGIGGWRAGDTLTVIEQGFLIGFDLHNDLTAGCLRNTQGFFLTMNGIEGQELATQTQGFDRLLVDLAQPAAPPVVDEPVEPTEIVDGAAIDDPAPTIVEEIRDNS